MGGDAWSRCPGGKWLPAGARVLCSVLASGPWLWVVEGQRVLRSVGGLWCWLLLQGTSAQRLAAPGSALEGDWLQEATYA